MTLSLGFCLNAQPDNQWLIKNGIGKNGVNSSLNNFYDPSQSITSGDLNIEGVKHRQNGQPLVPSSDYTNDFFAIFSDGSYNLGRDNISDTNFEPGEDYCFRLNQELKYLYLTNVYEEDDLPQGVTVSSNQFGSTCTQNLSPDPINRIFGFNHDIVDKTDLTLVLDGLNFKGALDDMGSTCSEFKICYEVDGHQLSTLDFRAEPFEEFNYLIQYSGVLQEIPESKEFNYGCMSFSFNRASPDNQFFNFKSIINDSRIIGSKVEFQIRCLNGTEVGRSWTENVSGKYHDPNGVTLQCVWEESNGKKFARYRVECFNESRTGDVTNVKLSLCLPEAALPGTVNIIKWDVGCTNGCGGLAVTNLLGTSPLECFEVDFAAGITEFNEDFDVCSYTAWFEFCVELNPTTILSSDPLYVDDPQTSFDGTPYPIPPFEQQLTCEFNQNQTQTTVVEPCRWERVVSDSACKPCKCCTGFCCWFKKLFTKKKAFAKFP